MVVFRTFRFHAARHLPNLDDNHICKQTHGHTFNLTVYVEGNIDTTTGFVIDFFDIDKIVNANILSIIDHKLLNDIPNLSNPTSENLSKWIWNTLAVKIDGLSKISLSEDHGTGIIYKGE
jgi:6-pyruvoyltetrahydropterin/6-carboxytetrahydropterin synthase